MKQSLLALALALTMLPVAAAAQTVTPDGGRPTLTPEQRQAMQTQMEAAHKQMDAYHTQFRTSLLGSLSAIHRQAFANIVGALAIAPKPDEDAAARQIDAILSPAERSSILAAHNTFKSQLKALHEQMKAQWERNNPQGNNAPPMGPRPPMANTERPEMNDPGHILLHGLAGGGHDMMFGHFGHGFGPPPA
jgi:hypothetical protein